MLCWVRFAWIALLAGLVSVSAEGGPLEEQFQVNTYTGSTQAHPVVAVDLEGDFVVVWDSRDGGAGNDTDSRSIQAQFYKSDGTPLGGEFQINSYTRSRQDHPSVAMYPDGGFVVAWRSLGSPGNDSNRHSIQGQRFASDGTPVGSQFQVNTYTRGDQEYPVVEVEADGDFVVVWSSVGSEADDSLARNIHGQRFASDGTPAGGEFQVNTYPINYPNQSSMHSEPSVAVDLDGNFVVVWDSLGLDNGDDDGLSIQGQRFASDGMPIGSQFLVNTMTTGSQISPDVAMGLDGGFLVVWRGVSDNGGGDVDIHGRQFASDGTALADDMTISTYEPSGQFSPEISIGLDGNLVIVWAGLGSPGNDDGDFSVHGRLFASDGTPDDSEFQFQINTYTRGNQWHPAVVMRSEDDFVAVWESNGSNGTDSSHTSGSSIQGRIHCARDCDFTDGFESGDTTAWSTSVGEAPFR